jgi:hypothetical protein
MAVILKDALAESFHEMPLHARGQWYFGTLLRHLAM